MMMAHGIPERVSPDADNTTLGVRPILPFDRFSSSADAALAYKEAGNAYSMSNFQTTGAGAGAAASGAGVGAGLRAPVAPFRHERGISHSGSVDTMATADLPAGMGSRRVSSEYGMNGGEEEYARGGASSPYR